MFIFLKNNLTKPISGRKLGLIWVQVWFNIINVFETVLEYNYESEKFITCFNNWSKIHGFC